MSYVYIAQNKWGRGSTEDEAHKASGAAKREKALVYRVDGDDSPSVTPSGDLLLDFGATAELVRKVG